MSRLTAGLLAARVLTVAVLAATALAAMPARAATSPEQARTMLQNAMEQRAKGNLAGAITALEPVIGALDAMQAQQATFCAESQAQAFLVMGTFAASAPGKTGKPAVVADQAFCLALFLKGFMLIDLGRAAEAEPFLRRATEAEPYNAQYAAEYAEWYKAARQWQRAGELFAKALDIAELADDARKPALKARALRGIGYVAIEQGRLDDAERNMRESQKLDPNNPAAKAELDYIASLRAKAAGK